MGICIVYVCVHTYKHVCVLCVSHHAIAVVYVHVLASRVAYIGHVSINMICRIM